MLGVAACSLGLLVAACDSGGGSSDPRGSDVTDPVFGRTVAECIDEKKRQLGPDTYAADGVAEDVAEFCERRVFGSNDD